MESNDDREDGEISSQEGAEEEEDALEETVSSMASQVGSQMDLRSETPSRPKYEDNGEDYDSNEDDDEPPEEILNRYAKEMAIKSEPEEFLDPKLCRVCKKNLHKYRCPKCNLRSCSLECSKLHKEQDVCDGIRPPFQPVDKLSQFDPQTSVRDQRWMSGIQTKVKSEDSNYNSYQNFCRQPAPPDRSHSANISDTPPAEGQISNNFQNGESYAPLNDAEQVPRQFPQYINEDGTRNSANNATERFLLPNAQLRRIFLSFSNEKEDDASRHEHFSDSIFWCIDLTFRRQRPDGSGLYDEYTHRLQNIPETIRICTILKQFLKPRKYGCIVSESDLDMTIMQPFIDAGLENILMLMRVPRYDKERYYLVNPEKNMLENLRNRVVLDHPKIIIILGKECFNMTTIAENEAEELREKIMRERSSQMNQGRSRRPLNNFRGNRGGGGSFNTSSDNFRGRGRGSGYGPPGYRQRPYDRPQRYNERGRGGMRGRGRGGHRGGGGFPGSREIDAFDPFEPFKGNRTLPENYGEPPVDNRAQAGCDSFRNLLTWENVNGLRTQPPPNRSTSTQEYVVHYPPGYQ